MRHGIAFDDCPAKKLSVLGYVITVCLHTHNRAQKDNGRMGSPNNTLPSYTLTHSQKPSAHQRPLCTGWGAQGCTMADGNPNQGFVLGNTLSGPLPGLSQQSYWPHCLGMKLITMSHPDFSGSPSGLRVAGYRGWWEGGGGGCCLGVGHIMGCRGKPFGITQDLLWDV